MQPRLRTSSLVLEIEHSRGNVPFESRGDPEPPPFPLIPTLPYLQRSHGKQVNVTAEAEPPFHATDIKSEPKRHDESNLIPQISLSLSLDYKPHEGYGYNNLRLVAP